MILSKTNNIHNSSQHRLSVQVSLIGLSFLVTDIETNKVVSFVEKQLDHSTTPEELLLDIESTISENEILQNDFQEVSVIYSTPIYSLVPISLFDETKASEYLKFNAKILTNDYMAHDILETQEIVVVYVPFMNINNFFFDKYGSFSYYHSITVMLKAILEKEKYALPKMYLRFQKNSFDCIVLKNGKIQLCNTYNYNTPEDFIYYTLFCIEQLKLNPETIPVLLCGAIDKDDENFKIAYTYIRNVEFADFSPKLKISEEEPPHRHFILKNAI